MKMKIETPLTFADMQMKAQEFYERVIDGKLSPAQIRAELDAFTLPIKITKVQQVHYKLGARVNPDVMAMVTVNEGGRKKPGRPRLTKS